MKQTKIRQQNRSKTSKIVSTIIVGNEYMSKILCQDTLPGIQHFLDPSGNTDYSGRNIYFTNYL